MSVCVHLDAKCPCLRCPSSIVPAAMQEECKGASPAIGTRTFSSKLPESPSV